MGPDHSVKRSRTLREHLRKATSHSHDLLDASMRPASDWRSSSDYARFLTAQLTARNPVEAWLLRHAPAELNPPEQTRLLRSDLQALGEVVTAADHKFKLDYRGEATAVGVAWVLAGSSLGNRAMLSEMKRTLPEDMAWPHAFLSSRAMTDFWKGLRTRVEAPVDLLQAKEASRAATAVFEQFLEVARACSGSEIVELEGA